MSGDGPKGGWRRADLEHGVNDVAQPALHLEEGAVCVYPKSSSLNAGILWCPRTFADGPHSTEVNAETGSIGLTDRGGRSGISTDRQWHQGLRIPGLSKNVNCRVARTVAVNDTRDICGFPAALVVKRQWRWPTQGTLSSEKELARQSVPGC